MKTLRFIGVAIIAIIISTNLTLKELEKSYHQRLVSRIIGEMLRLKFIGRDIRQMQYNDTVKKG